MHPPTEAEAQRVKPTAKGPVSVKLGLPMATAYTTATSRKVIVSSHPNAIPCNAHLCCLNRFNRSLTRAIRPVLQAARLVADIMPSHMTDIEREPVP